MGRVTHRHEVGGHLAIFDKLPFEDDALDAGHHALALDPGEAHDQDEARDAAGIGDAAEGERLPDLVVQLLEELLAEFALGLFFRGQPVVGPEPDRGDGDRDPRRRR